jgi:hypothetical protein
MMRDLNDTPTEPELELLTGEDYTDPLFQVNMDDDGASVQPVHALATEDGEPQMALSRGGFGTLRRAGSP